MFELRYCSHWASHGLAATLLGLTLSCGSGGSSGSVAPISFEFASSTTTTPEGGGAAAIGIRLALTIDELLEDATVEISDSGAGSAQVGSDYMAFATQTLTFVAGSTNGTTQMLNLTSLGDTSFEGNETVSLQLSNPTGGSGLGTTNSMIVEINESQVSSLQFQTTSATSADETANAVNVNVELNLAPGVLLANDLTVVVGDSFAGNAMANVDYTAIAQTLTFPVGSGDGTVRSSSFTVRPDTTMELDETLVLELREPTLNATIGANSTFTYTITDDDVSAAPFFRATAVGLGDLNYGQAVNVGTQSLNAGPNVGVAMTIANQGAQAMTLFTPNLSGADASDFSVEASIGALAPAAEATPTVMASPLAHVFEHPTEGVELAIDAAMLLPLRGSSDVILSGFPLPGGGTCELELAQVRSPWSSDATVYKNGVPVTDGPGAVVPDLSIWKGTIFGDDDSSAFLSFSSHGCRGWIRYSDSPDDIVHLVTDFDNSGPVPVTRSRLIHPMQMIAAGANQTSPSSICGGALVPPGEEDPAAMLLSQATTAGLTLSDCRLAIETDFQFYQQFGDEAAAIAYVTQLIAAVSDVYLRDVQTTLSIAYLGVHTTAGDPWSTPDTSGTTADMLAEFRGAWAGNWPVQADLAHFISGAGLGGGIAYVNTLCSNAFGFGVSGSLNTNIDWGTWTGQSSFLNWDFVVVAHEIGHNFGASHTHNYCPPIDQCSSANCNSTQICSRGTIMSYCHTCAGGLSNIDIEFHPQVANQMRSSVNTSCLGSASLAAGETLDYQLRFRPTSSAGAKNATLNISHGGTNVSSPFVLQLTGDSTP